MKNILVTGFPGFLAGFLVKRLAERAERIHLLVEERFAEKAETLSGRIAIEIGRPISLFRVVPGDIAREGLGLAEKARDELLAEADTVFHLAAIYDLAMGREIGMKVNVAGTENVNAFVRRMRALARYHYISTAFVAGDVSGAVREDDFFVGQRFRNFYEETKHLAEKAVRQMLAEFPVTIFRPTVVVGHSRTGYTVKYDGPYMALRMIRRLPGFLGRVNFGTDHPFNIVPIDFIVDAMVAIAQRPDSARRTFHLGQPAPMTSREIAELFCRIVKGKGTWGKVPSWVMRAGQHIPAVPWILGVPRQTVPYFYADIQFDCSGTLDMLAGTGVSCPRLSDYAENIVRYYLEHPVPGA
ncbi:MAG: SDR family oxidoreductase [Planctomycetes bacterium]|nr:SDR family oxidoreductase [Planctomycetota bacterium]